MTAISNLRTWLDYGNEPEGAQEAFDLERTLRGSSFGQYRSQPKKGGLLLITGPGERAFLFHQVDTEKHVAALRKAYRSEPGASLHGDAAFARGMNKDD